MTFRWLLVMGGTLAALMTPGCGLHAQAAFANDSAQTLPIPRLLTAQPPVTAVGTLPDGRIVPITPKLAVGDLGYYGGILSSIHPFSADTFPADSIREVKLQRACAWLTRLVTTTYPDADGTEALMLADVALRANEDSMARGILDRLLAPAQGPVARSFVLGAAISLLTEAIEDSARYATRTAVAVGYGAELSRLHGRRYASRRDSVNVLQRQTNALIQLVAAYARLNRLSEALKYTDQAVTASANLSQYEQRSLFTWYYPMQDVATLLLMTQSGRSALETNVQLKTILRLAPDLQEQFDRAAMRGRPAPPLTAHAWLGRPDSAYAPEARTYVFTPGVVHLIAFGYRGNIVIADRLLRRFAGIRGVVMNETGGNISYDPVEPPEEIEWLRVYLRVRRHLTIPIGIWAGPRQPNGFGGMIPERSPLQQTYHVDVGQCVVVDGHGLVRAIMPMRSRVDEARIAAFLTTLTTEHAP